jgi:hypothetical protein
MTNDKDSAVLDILERIEALRASLRKSPFILKSEIDHINAIEQEIIATRLSQPTQSDALAPIGTEGKYVNEDLELSCHVTAHIEGWLEVKFKGDNSPAVIRPSRFIPLQEQSK